MSFDDESKALYDAVAPRHTEAHFEGVRAELDRLLPGRGSLIDRYGTFLAEYVIPPEKLESVFNVAITECRRRTLRWIDLPPEESLTVEYVTGKSWGAQNWYQGDYHSLIQVNVDLPMAIDRVLDLACHEGYPGHHVCSTLTEKRLVRERGWVEFSVLPLFSPRALIMEGTAMFGIDVAFPARTRLAFERDRLYSLAGLNPAQAEEYDHVRRLINRLSYAVNEAARRYLDGHIASDQAPAWLEIHGLMPAEHARRRVRFIDDYRSYAINYNLGHDVVRAHVEVNGGTAERPDRRWQVLKELLHFPWLPSTLDSH